MFKFHIPRNNYGESKQKKTNQESFFIPNLMYKLFHDKQEAIINTPILQKDARFKKKEPKLPKVFSGTNNDENNTLKNLATKGLLRCLNIDSFSDNYKNFDTTKIDWNTN